MHHFTAFLFIAVFYSFSLAQEKTPEQEDTLTKHSPKKAIILSSCVPGSGQIYNHIFMPKGKRNAYWKVPLIYACLGTTSYFLLHNQQTQKALKLDYTNRLNGGSPDPRWQQFDDDGVLELYNQYLTKRDLSILGVGFVYLLQLADAGIEAHFVNFDISKDLSMRILPTSMNSIIPGMKFQLNFHN